MYCTVAVICIITVLGSTVHPRLYFPVESSAQQSGGRRNRNATKGTPKETQMKIPPSSHMKETTAVSIPKIPDQTKQRKGTEEQETKQQQEAQTQHIANQPTNQAPTIMRRHSPYQECQCRVQTRCTARQIHGPKGPSLHDWSHTFVTCRIHASEASHLRERTSLVRWMTADFLAYMPGCTDGPIWQGLPWKKTGYALVHAKPWQRRWSCLVHQAVAAWKTKLPQPRAWESAWSAWSKQTTKLNCVAMALCPCHEKNGGQGCVPSGIWYIMSH
jgi:hypothetical protein